MLTVLTLEAIRLSGPLLDSAYSRAGAPAVALTAVVTYAAPAPVVALLLASTRQAARARPVALLAGAVLLGLLRPVVQALHGEARVLVGLVVVAAAVAVLTLAVSVLTSRSASGRPAAAAVLTGTAASVGLQLALGTWDALWRHSLLGWVIAVGLAVLVVLLGVLQAGQPVSTPVWPARRVWALGPALALAAMMLANPAFAAAQSSLPLALAGPLLGLGLLFAAMLAAGWSGPATRRRRSAAVSAAVLVAGTAVALLVRGSGPAASALVVAALLAAQLGTALALDRAWSSPAPAPGRPGRSSGPRPAATVAATGVVGLTTIVPLLLHQLHYDIPLGFPNLMVLVATAVLLAVAGLLDGAGFRVETGLRRGGGRTVVGLPLAAAAVLLAAGSAVALAAVVRDRSAAAAPSTGRVVSWNLHYGVSPTGSVDLEAVARVIEAQDPDVVLLQEVGRGWIQGGGVDMASWLSHRLGREFAFAPAADGRFGNVVLARGPLTDVRVQPLPFGAGPQRRSALTAVAPVGGRLTTVTSLHLQHRAGNSPTRVAQVDAFLGAVAAGPAQVVGGDLNAVPGTPEVRALTAAGYVSAVDAVGNPDALTDPSTAPRRRIDWVFGRGLSFSEARVLTAVQLSDHLPLVVGVRP